MKVQNKYTDRLNRVFNNNHITIDFGSRNKHDCGPKCYKFYKGNYDSYARFFGANTEFNKIKTNKIILALPVATLIIPEKHDDYLGSIKGNSRRSIKKSEKLGYEFKKIVWNNYLNDIHEINTSKEKRCGRRMADSYRKFPGTKSHIEDFVKAGYCKKHFFNVYGCLKNGKLYAYLLIVFNGNTGCVSQTLGHGDFLKDGIIYGLFSYMVQDVINNYNWIKHICYTDMNDTNISRFKRHIGFVGRVGIMKVIE